MERITRRAVLLGSTALCGCLALGRVVMATELSAGCRLSARSADRLDASLSKGIGVVGQELLFTTGDAEKDKALGRALVRLSQLFNERPGFGFIDDSGDPNAYAKDDIKVAGTWGTVRFGKTLFQDLMNRFDDGGIAILAVVAHEFAHIAQYHRGYMETLNAGQKTVKRSELHADLLAGYFLGTRKMADSRIKLRTAGLALYQIGDYGFNQPDHHGTPEERVDAAQFGYGLANKKKTFDEAFQEGADWIFAHSRA